MLRVTGDRPLLHRMIVFLLRSVISRRNNAPSPVTRDPRMRGCVFCFLWKICVRKRVTAGTGPCYVGGDQRSQQCNLVPSTCYAREYAQPRLCVGFMNPCLRQELLKPFGQPAQTNMSRRTASLMRGSNRYNLHDKSQGRTLRFSLGFYGGEGGI